MRKYFLFILCLGHLTLPSRAQDHEGAEHGKHEAHEKSEVHDAHEHDEHEGHVDEVHLTTEAIERYGIRVESAARHALRPEIVAPARVTFNQEAMAHVGSAVAGRVSEIKVRVGDRVKQGQELLVIQSPELGRSQSAYLLALTNTKVAEIALEPLKTAFERGKALYDQHQGISLADLQQRQAEYQSAQGAVETARAAAASEANTLLLMGMSDEAVGNLSASGKIDPRCVISAPIEGDVLEREVTLGELATPEHDALLVLADTRSLWVLAEVSENQLAMVELGASATIRTASRPDDALSGKVSHIAAAMDSRTRTGHVRIDLPNPDGRLKAGMFAKASIVIGPADAAAILAIPEQAVQTVEGGPAVFVPVEGEENTFAKRAVTIGPSVGGMVPVLSGLAEGEKFVAAGTFILKADLGKSSAGHDHAH